MRACRGRLAVQNAPSPPAVPLPGPPCLAGSRHTPEGIPVPKAIGNPRRHQAAHLPAAGASAVAPLGFFLPNRNQNARLPAVCAVLAALGLCRGPALALSASVRSPFGHTIPHKASTPRLSVLKICSMATHPALLRCHATQVRGKAMARDSAATYACGRHSPRSP